MAQEKTKENSEVKDWSRRSDNHYTQCHAERDIKLQISATQTKLDANTVTIPLEKNVIVTCVK